MLLKIINLNKIGLICLFFLFIIPSTATNEQTNMNKENTTNLPVLNTNTQEISSVPIYQLTRTLTFEINAVLIFSVKINNQSSPGSSSTSTTVNF